MKKIFAIILTAVILVSVMAISTNAARPPQKYGDADADQNISVLDATIIQMHLANIEGVYLGHYEGADVDGDNEISIMDATTIQLYLANIITTFPAGEFFLVDKSLYDVIPSYLSGKAQAGVPVDFKVCGYAYPEPSVAYLYVSDKLVDTATGDDSTLTYTFPQKGIYRVEVVLTDKWGEEAGRLTKSYEVIDPVTDTTNPFIKNITIDDTYSTNPTITVDVINGSGDYTYSYYVSCPYLIEEERDFFFSKQDVKENSVTLGYGLIDHGDTYVVTVYVTDSNGNTASGTASFICKILVPA